MINNLINLPSDEQERFQSLKRIIATYFRTCWNADLLTDEDEYILLAESGIKHIAVSVFDHYLRRDELHLLPSLDAENADETYSAYAKRMAESNTKLYNSTRVLSYRICGKGKYNRVSRFNYRNIRLKKFKSLSAFKTLAAYEPSELLLDYRFPGLVLPEYHAFYVSEFDYTNRLFFTAETDLDSLKKLICESGLYCLEPR